MAAFIGIALALLAVLPFVLLLRARIGFPGAVAVGGVIGSAAFLAVLLLSAAISAPILVSLAVVGAAIAIAGLIACRRAGVTVVRPRLLIWLPVLLAPAGWLGVLAAARLIPGASRLSWVMQGDSANNILFAREVLQNGGIVLAAGANPVPLPSALLAVAMGIGRDGLAGSDLLGHDLAAFTVLWGVLIALSAVMAAILAGSIARACEASPRVIAVTTAFGSVLPFSWFITGYATEFGFFNAHLSLILLSAAVIVFLEAARSPSGAFAVLTLIGTLLLATWSPLVLVPAMLCIALLARSWRGLLLGRRRILVVSLGLFQVLVYGFVAVLPGLIANGDALSAPGGIFAFSWVMLPGLGVGALCLSLLASRSRAVLANSDLSRIPQAVFGVVAACALGLVALLTAAGGRWTYYPHKFAWLASALLVIIIVGLLVPAAASLSARRSMLVVASVAVAAGALAFTQAAPTIDTGERRQNPIPRIIEGNVFSPGGGDVVADQIIDLADTGIPRLLWMSQEPFEDDINFWLLEMQVERISEQFDLRVAAYNIEFQSTTTDLCSDLVLLDSGAIVLTRQHDLAEQLYAECPEISVTVEQLPIP